MAPALVAEQYCFDLFSPAANGSGFTLDAATTRTSALPPEADEPSEPQTVPDGAPRGFRLIGERDLARTWIDRARDNLAALRLTREIESHNRRATPDEQARLMRFIGFGASELANGCFPRPGDTIERPGWEAVAQELRSLVTAEEYAALARCTQYAHYTPEPIARAVWDGLLRLGFSGGRILEPGVGTGMFLAVMPNIVRVTSHTTGIELDPVTARIARLIHSDASIRNEDFTRADVPSHFDLAIGNPPFSDRIVQTDPRYKGLGLRLHDYFIIKSLNALKPDGLAAFVTSTGTMDKADPGARHLMAAGANLIAAVRLPAGIFRAAAGTDVGVDILYFQKRAASTCGGGGSEWDELAEVAAASGTARINRYFIRHPAHVLGEHSLARSPYGPGLSYRCAPKPGADPIGNLSQIVAAFESTNLTAPASRSEPADLDAEAHPALSDTVGTAADGAWLKNGSYFVSESDVLMQVEGANAHPVPIKRHRSDRGIPVASARLIRALIPIRDSIRRLLRAQAEDRPWQDAQRALRVSYGAFLRHFGPINLTTVSTQRHSETGEAHDVFRRPNLTPFLDDPDGWLVASIEDYDMETGTARPGPIFTERVIAPPAPPIIETATDALAVVLNETGRADPARIAELLGCTEDQVIAELGELIFQNPVTGAWEPADAYLSGTVRTKLEEAERAAASDRRYDRNVAALKRVQPQDLPPSAITARLGAPWIPADTVRLFAAEILHTRTSITHSVAVACWSVDTGAFAGTAAGTTEWGTSRRNAGELLEDALNARIPQIYDSWRDSDGEHRVLNVEATEAAKDKLARIKTAFTAWIWTDPERTDRLARLYNDRFNNLVPRHFDGSHLTLAAASRVIQFYAHQKRAIWRIITSGATYIAHAVGAGKTYSIAAAIMEQKRLGLIAKPLLVVPGHCLAQASREFLALYPTARILVADETNFVAAKRYRFLARAATDTWDAIIITHSAFKLIPSPTDFERELVRSEIADYEALLLDPETGNDHLTRKRIERLKEGLEERLAALRSRKDNMLTLAELGIDQIIVDEAQEFRKLSFATNTTGLKGVDPDGSQRAWDLYVKSRFVETRRPGRGLILASGTPITNTLGELFTIQRFMQPTALRERGVHNFDAWASSFGDTVTELELQPSGLYKPATRFAEFVNVPELIAMFRSFADVVRKEDLRESLKLPRIKGGQRQLVTAEPSAAFKAYQRHLGDRIKAIELRSGRPQKGDDILLSVITDGRHAAIDLRLVDNNAGDDSANKLNLLIDTVFRIWRDTSTRRYTRTDGRAYDRPGAGQLVFSDLGTLAVESTRGFSAYRWIKDRLVRLGVPAGDIAFMQDYKKSDAKQRLFNDFNAGRVRILIGSSDTMGTGVNVQRRLLALHHLDVPWLPSQIEQREGRIERQGNAHDEIEIYAYATLGSMDATMWQNNERKARFISAALAGDRSIRRLEDAGSPANQFALAKAIASGDQRLMQKAGLESEIARLERLQAAHIDDQHAIRRSIYMSRANIRHAEERISSIANDIASRDQSTAGLTVGGQARTDLRAGATALLVQIKSVLSGRPQGRRPLGTYCGFPLEFVPHAVQISGKFGYDVVLQRHRHDHDTRINLGLSAEAVVMRLREIVLGFEADIDSKQRAIAADTKRIAEFEVALGAQFAFAAELALKRDQLAAIEADLAATSVREAA
jgi:N12 class adenine-specific DNA methylase/adenine-specific DNA methylase